MKDSCLLATNLPESPLPKGEASLSTMNHLLTRCHYWGLLAAVYNENLPCPLVDFVADARIIGGRDVVTACPSHCNEHSKREREEHGSNSIFHMVSVC